MDQTIHRTLQVLLAALEERLPGADPTVYLYGSVPAGDFRPGWSDIDLLVLTRRDLTPAEADRLVSLRQELTDAEPFCPYFRAYEGGILPLQAFLTGAETRAVYWGTSGQRVKPRHELSAFERWQLHHQSLLLRGEDVRDRLPCPTRADLTDAVRAHLRTIRDHGSEDAGLYSFGWLLDIARGLYTLRTGHVIAKTAAGEWALAEELCPDEAALTLALTVRRDPSLIRRPDIQSQIASLAPAIQRFADVLETELSTHAG